MKYIFLIIFFLSPIFANTPIDIKKFSGLWYEIARVENSFQTSCVASSIEYKLQQDNSYAKLENNQLFMKYFFIFRTSYKIEYLNDYKTAVVVNDNYSNLWIMSRTPNIDKNELEKILNDLKTKMDISKLVFTKLDPKGRYK